MIGKRLGRSGPLEGGAGEGESQKDDQGGGEGFARGVGQDGAGAAWPGRHQARPRMKPAMAAAAVATPCRMKARAMS